MQKSKFFAVLLCLCLLVTCMPPSIFTTRAMEYSTPFESEDIYGVEPMALADIEPFFTTPVAQPLVVSDSVNYVRIWGRRHVTGAATQPDVVVITATGTNSAAVNVFGASRRDQVFRLVAVPGNNSWFYITSMTNNHVLTVSGNAVTLAPRSGGNHNQHFRLVYTAEGLHYYNWVDPRGGNHQWGAVTHGVYRHIQNRATNTYLSNPNPATGGALTLSAAVGRNDIATQWNILPADYEALVRGPVPDTRTRTSWEDFAIISPIRDRLNPAGRLNLTWANANGFNAQVTGYRVYVNGVFQALVPQSNASTLTHRFYALDVARHTVRVNAMVGSTVVASSEIAFFVTSKGLAAGAPMRAPQMGVAWYYTWGMNPVPGADHLEFVPMQWGNATQATIQNNMRTAINRGDTTFLGFNEPDLAAEANMPVQTVVNRWLDSFVPLGDQIRLGSPVTAVPNNQYMQDFMAGVRRPDGSYPMDFIAYHHYADWPNFAQFQTQLLRSRELWPTLPVWVTEMGARSPSDWVWPNHQWPQDNVLYREFEQLINFMSDTYWIERFAWFTFRPHVPGSPTVGGVGTNYRGMRTTYDPHTGALWPLGLIFRYSGNPAGYVLPPLEPTIDAAGTFDIVLPTSANTIHLAAPVAGERAATTVSVGQQLVGNVTWTPAPPNGVFDGNTTYTATIRLQSAPGRSYQMGIVPRDFFHVPGAAATNPAGSGAVTAVFPQTGDAPQASGSTLLSPRGVNESAPGNRSVRTFWMAVDLSDIAGQVASASNPLVLEVNLTGSGTNIGAVGEAGNSGLLWNAVAGLPIGQSRTLTGHAVSIAAADAMGLQPNAHPFNITFTRANGVTGNTLAITASGGSIPANASGHLLIPIVVFVNNSTSTLTLRNTRTNDVLIDATLLTTSGNYAPWPSNLMPHGRSGNLIFNPFFTGQSTVHRELFGGANPAGRGRWWRIPTGATQYGFVAGGGAYNLLPGGGIQLNLTGGGPTSAIYRGNATFIQSAVPMVAGTSYQFGFTAYASIDRSIDVRVAGAGNAGDFTSVNLTTVPQTFTFNGITAPFGGSGAGANEATFRLGTELADIWAGIPHYVTILEVWMVPLN